MHALAWLTAAIWTLVVGGSLVFSLYNEEQEGMKMAYAEARANLNKDITLRRWATEHGGVYVPITEKQQSVPWLNHVPGRDVTTTDGRQLTLLNPATVVRQMMDHYAQDYGVRGRITGLKYLNPGNKPDAWETEQLEAFTRKEKKEVWAVSDINGQPNLRYLRAMFMEPGCETCHAILGYKLGDMRGATGVNLPLAAYYRQIDTASRNLGVTHGVFWLLGLGGIGLALTMLGRRERELEQSKAIIDSTNDAIVSKTLDGLIESWNPGAERLFGYTAAQVIGQSARILTPKERWNEEPEILERIRNGEKIDHFETVRRCQDGRLIDISTTISPILSDEGKVVGASVIARDITARKFTENQLLKLSLAVEQSPESIVITNLKAEIEYVNEAFVRTTGYSREDAIGKNPRILQSGATPQETFIALWDAMAHERPWKGELHNQRKDGSPYLELAAISPIRQPDGRITHYLAVKQDITEIKAAEEEINSLAFYDPLTRLPNRRLLLDRLKQALTASARNGNYGALLLIDLDHFKTLNDTMGHDVGDLLLKQVAHRITLCVRDGDTVARFGGDEFLVILVGLSSKEKDAGTATESVSGKILASFKQTHQLGSLVHHSTASIGVTLFKGDAASVDDLIKQADLAMYKAKSVGRNLVRFFDPTLESAVKERAALERDLREAVSQNQFRLYYQAQVVETGRVIGAEVLVRWQHPTRGIVSPGEFISLVEETGLILPLGRWVLETACTQLSLWAHRPDRAHLTIAVNVSARQFHQDNFVDQVMAVLKSTGANPQRLKLELTESLLVLNVDTIIEKMLALKALGVTFSLDDFGTGYSSLSYLKRLPLDQLKIDQSFVRDILIDSDDATIAKMIIELAGSLGLEVIAEGVETQGQRDFLAAQGCRVYQGYLFSRPLPLAGFEALGLSI